MVTIYKSRSNYIYKGGICENGFTFLTHPAFICPKVTDKGYFSLDVAVFHNSTSNVRECLLPSLFPTLGSGKLINVFADFMEDDGVLYIFPGPSLQVRLRITYFHTLIICVFFL